MGQGIDRFKQQIRPEDRPASRGFKERWNDWIELLKERQVLNQDECIDWRLSWGLTSRRFREEYLDPSIQRGIAEPFGRPTKYRVCNSYKEEEPEEQAQQPKNKLQKVIDKHIADEKEKQRIKQKMLEGPCKHRCPPGETEEDPDCRNCTGFTNLKDKSFLDE